MDIDLKFDTTAQSRQHIAIYHDLCPDNRLWKLLHEQGQVFKNEYKSIYPYQQGPEGMCFNNCLTMALVREEITYCEGFATADIGGGIGVPMHHAWLVAGDGEVIDITWHKPGLDYFGIPFDREFLRKHALDSGLPSILDNHRLRRVYESTPDQYRDERHPK